MKVKMPPIRKFCSHLFLFFREYLYSNTEVKYNKNNFKHKNIKHKYATQC